MAAAPGEAQLTWFDRTGSRIRLAGPTAVYRNTTLSRDGRFVAFDRGSPADIWMLDLETAAASRITTDRAGNMQC